MAAILDMRKYPPHCPRPSTNSPIHPRADSTLQPRPPYPRAPRSTIRRPSLTELPPCLLARLPSPRPYKVRADAFPRAKGMLSSYYSPRSRIFLKILDLPSSRLQQRYSLISFGNQGWQCFRYWFGLTRIHLTDTGGRRSRRNLIEIMSWWRKANYVCNDFLTCD